MRSGFRYTCLCAAFLISLLTGNYNAKADNDSLFVVTMERMGDSLHSLGQYRDASLAYEKAIYFNANAVSKASLSLKRAHTLKQISSFDIAEQTLSRVDLSALSDSLVYQVKYNAAMCAYLNADFSMAESHLIQLIYFGRDTARVYNCYPLFALALNELNKYDSAKVYLKKYVDHIYPKGDEVGKVRLREIDSLYAAKSQPHLKRVRKAKIMSLIIPGLGQMYAGYWGEGITAMTCNAIFLGLTGVGVYYKYYITSVMYSYTVFAKFYSGNLSRVEYLVKKRNYKVQKNYHAALKQNILKYWK
ncbi:MAG: tetratricopeptide repeat protein [Bacteroidia bacterium]